MRGLKQGDNGEDVKKWQGFLKDQNLYRGEVDGQFGAETKQATLDFQRFHELRTDEGAVTNRTLGLALLAGFELIDS